MFKWSRLDRPLTWRDVPLVWFLCAVLFVGNNWLWRQTDEENWEMSYQEYGRFFATVERGDTMESLTERAVKAQMIWDGGERKYALWVVRRANPGVTTLAPGDRVAMPITTSGPPARIKMYYDFGYRWWVDILAVDRHEGDTTETIGRRCQAIGAVMAPCGSSSRDNWFYDLNPNPHKQAVWRIPILLQQSDVQSIGVLQALWDVHYGENHGATATLVTPVPR